MAFKKDRRNKEWAARSDGQKRRFSRPEERERERVRALQMCAEGKFRKPIGSYTGITKEDREWYNRRAKEKAQETIRIMAEKGILTPNDDPRAVKALEAAVEMLESPAPQREKLAAARLILDFTKAKPASSSIVTVNKAEEWLAAITKEEGDAEGPAGNSEETSR